MATTTTTSGELRNRKTTKNLSKESDDDKKDEKTKKNPMIEEENVAKKKNPWYLWLIPSFMIVTSFVILFYLHGFDAILPNHYRRHSIDHQGVLELLREKTMLFVGGPHRGGTTLLFSLLYQHPDISGHHITQRFQTEQPVEGVFVQTVYPTFGLANELNAAKFAYGIKSKAPRGLGRYMINKNHHLTERSKQYLTVPLRTLLMQEWGWYWNMTAPILMDKSPPNMIISRYLQKLLTLEMSETEKEQTKIKFLFTTRHPLAVALAHQAEWMACKDLTIYELVLNWLLGHETLQEDLPYLTDTFQIRFEEI